MSGLINGLPPFGDTGSEILILGSFPSVLSRKAEFYYGNPLNRFWNTLAGYFGENTPQTAEDKKRFLLSHRIALWDIVTECEISGSKDSAIKNFKVADIKSFLQNKKIGFIILNGRKAYTIFSEHFKDLGVPYERVQSTSPANTHFKKEQWFDVLSRAFGRA